MAEQWLKNLTYLIALVIAALLGVLIVPAFIGAGIALVPVLITLAIMALLLESILIERYL